MLKKLSINKLLWQITTGVTLFVAFIGVLFPRMYDGLFAKEFIPGAFPQDILTVMICIYIFIAIARLTENSMKMQIFIIGLMGSFFYLYGIFTMERVYNFLYVFYAAIFSFSFWSILFSLISFKPEFLEKVKLPSLITKISAITGIIIASLFTFLWISALIPLMRDHNRIEYLYSIYILDLCFIMPAFFITSILSLRKNGWGIVLLPAVYIVGFFVIFPLGLGEIAKGFSGQSVNIGNMVFSFIFSILMLVIGLTHLRKIYL